MTAALSLLPPTSCDDQGRLIGVFCDMPEEQYFKVKAFSYSFSKSFAKSPAHGQAYLTREWTLSPDREKYKAVHILALEPENRDRIAVVDGIWRGAVKDEVRLLQEQGKLVVKKEAFKEAEEIASVLRAHRLAGGILSTSIPEVSIFWIDKETGVYCKGRIDALHLSQDDLFIGDLKNCGDISDERTLWGLITKNRYHWQQAFYKSGLETILGRTVGNQFWLFVEEEKPHGVKVRTCTEAMIERAMEDVNANLKAYKACEESGHWPCYSEEAEPANLTFYGWENSDE